jgi:hypothetical protein
MEHAVNDSLRTVREAALKGIDARLATDPEALDLRFERAHLCEDLGRTDEAKTGYEDVLARDPMHFAALNDLATLLYKTGRRRVARVSFVQLVARHPQHPIAQANLAYTLLKNREFAAAREHYEQALALDPQHAEAHRGLALTLAALGDHAAASAHGREGFRDGAITVIPYRGEGTPVRVLLLVTASAGNVATKLVVEYADLTQPLPAHDLLFNAVGDADICGEALTAVEHILARTNAPHINRPDAVRATTRAGNAERLGALAGVVTPRVASLPRALLAGPEGPSALVNHGLPLPYLLRSPGFHTGEHFARVDDDVQLANVVATLPGEELLAIEFLDVRGGDGKVRKYRAMFIDGAIYPLHLAISTAWKVHYFSADMTQDANHRAEDAAFLRDMPAVLGPRAMAALAAIRDALGLDYGGIDFALSAAGDVVVFEANATMIVPTPGADERWAYRREPVARIDAAVRTMLFARVGTIAQSPHA